jgi:hypothetical protein
MDRVPRVARLAFTVAPLTLAALSAAAPPAWAQAWVPPAGLGSVTVATQTIHNTGHTDTDGVFTRIGRSVNTRIDLEADYAVTDRFSLSAGLPFVFARYVDALPYGPPGVAVGDVPAGSIPFPPRDECRCWQSGWQDFGFTARYNVINQAFALTPSVTVGVPSHDYEYRGEAVVGQRLKELRLRVDAGQRLDAISPRLSVQGSYSYAFVERVLDDVPNNRSNAKIEGGFAISRRLAARGLLLWQHVHGGLRFGGPDSSALPFPGDVNTPERMFEHDRLLRDNNWRLGAGITYSMRQMDLFASYVEFVRGTDSHAGRALTAGVGWPFELGRRQAP